MSTHSIELSSSDISVIQDALSEFFGGSADCMFQITEVPEDAAREIQDRFDASIRNGNNMVTLEAADWRTIYNSINAAIYALGPFELGILFSANLLEVLQTNLKICTELWNVYGGLTWTDAYQIDRK